LNGRGDGGDVHSPRVADAQLVFLHVPKTAGTTIRGIAYAHYGEARIAPIYPGESMYLGIEEFASLPEALRDRADLVIGHVMFGFHRHLSGKRPFRYATMLRDPIRRCASLYDHFASIQFHGAAPALPGLLEGPEGIQFNNHQTRTLSGMPAPLGKCPRAMLDKAKENIEQAFVFLGITELFEESLLLAGAALGWPLRPYETRNVSAQNPGWRLHQMTETAEKTNLDRLEEMNSLDRELYDYARGRFLAQLQSTVPDWQVQLVNFRQRLANSPVSAMRAVGSLAPLQPNRVAGWSKLVGRDLPTRVRIEIAGRQPQTVPALLKRDDLRAASVHFASACGFVLDLPADATLRQGDRVRAFNADTGQELGNSPRILEEEAVA
jgi:hypothetical protein